MSYVLKLGTVYGTPIFTLQCTDMAVKNVYGATFSGRDKTWRFPAFYPVHKLVLTDLEKTVPTMVKSPEVEAHIKQLAVPSVLPEDFRFLTEPYQHQRDGVLHLLRNLRAALFYSPGLGKCKITVDLQRLTKDRMLVLCPLVMLGTWADEFNKHGAINDVLILDGSKKEKLARIAQAQAHPPTVTVVTYNVASLYTNDILKIGYSAIIADESHLLKSPFSKRTVAASTLATRAYRRILLSGTPSLGSPFDLYAQLRFLGNYFCSENWWAFRKLFGVFPDFEANENVPKMLLGFKNIDIMNDRVNLVALRKTKEECLDLPDQTIIDEYFVVSSETKKMYNTLILDHCLGAGLAIQEEELNGSLNQESGVQVAPHVIAHETISQLNKLDQIASNFVYLATKNPGFCNGCEHVVSCTDKNIKPYTKLCKIVKSEPESIVDRISNNARLDRCMGLLESILEDSDNKVIIWARYIPELDALEEAFKKENYGYVRVQGGLSREELTDSMNKFNNESECRIYLAQVATGIGVTLNAANYTIYFNLPWSLDHYQQSMDRNYRIGQKRKVTVYRLIARDTLDVSKVAALDQKVDFSKLVTAKAICATCSDYHKRCAKYKIEVYDPECKYDRTMMRKTARIGLIP